MATAEANKKQGRAARHTRTRSPPFTTEDMAAPANVAKAKGDALWEAAKEGNTAQASRLLDAGAPLDWKNAAMVSSEADGTLTARRRGDGVNHNQPGAFLPPVGLLHHGPRGKTCRPSTVMTIRAAAKRAECRWAASARWRQSQNARAVVVEGMRRRRMVLQRLLRPHPVATRTRWSCWWTGAPTWRPRTT